MDVSLSVCFFVSVLFVCLSAAAAWYIEDDEGGLRWGKSVSCLGAEPWRVVHATSKLDQASVRGEEGLGKTEEVPLRK